jgi:hypothetical protein
MKPPWLMSKARLSVGKEDAGILAADGDALHGSEIAVGGPSFI